MLLHLLTESIHVVCHLHLVAEVVVVVDAPVKLLPLFRFKTPVPTRGFDAVPEYPRPPLLDIVFILFTRVPPGFEPPYLL
jgi:hypothetical protein